MNKPNLLVVDSSVAVKWILVKDELYIRQADKILHAQKAGVIELFMPELAKYEMGNVLLNKKLTLKDIETSIEMFYKIPIKFYEENMMFSILTAKIAFESKITFYDASFIALAEKLNADLVTDNPKHQSRYKGKVKVIALKDY